VCIDRERQPRNKEEERKFGCDKTHRDKEKLQQKREKMREMRDEEEERVWLLDDCRQQEYSTKPTK
jgi:hypothetical protein